ncbi:hypothetical protein D3C86_1832500 [compost metagenome]
MPPSGDAFSNWHSSPISNLNLNFPFINPPKIFMFPATYPRIQTGFGNFACNKTAAPPEIIGTFNFKKDNLILIPSSPCR